MLGASPQRTHTRTPAPVFIGGDGYLLYLCRGAARPADQAPHFHDEYVISLQLRGEAACRVGGESLRLGPGDFVLINPQQVHAAEAPRVGEEAESEYVTLYVEPRLVAALLDDVEGETTCPEFVTAHAPRRGDLARKLLEILEVAADDGDPTSESTRAAVEGAMQELLVAIFEDFSNLRIPMQRSTARVGHRKVAQALEFMRSLPRADGSPRPTTEELAAVAGLSKFHFIREFERHVGMTPGAYLRMLRLTEATRLLRATQLRVSDIALNVGFADHPSFSRSFTRTMGMTPVAYRRIWAD